MWGLCYQSHRTHSRLHISYTGHLSPCLFCGLRLIISPLPAHPQGFLFSSLSSAHGSAPLPEDKAALSQTITRAWKGWCECETLFWIQPFSSETSCRFSPGTYRTTSRVLQALSTQFLWFVKLSLKTREFPAP